jgi:hypothetical protein
MLRRPPTRLRLDLRLPPAQVEERLRSSMGIVRSLLLSPTSGLSEPFVGRVADGQLEMRVRHGYSNGLTRLFCGRVSPTPAGSRLEGQFRTLWFVVLILRLAWLGFLVPIGFHLVDLARASSGAGRTDWLAAGLGLAGPAATLGFLLLIEILARSMGDRDEERMRRHLTELLAE